MRHMQKSLKSTHYARMKKNILQYNKQFKDVSDAINFLLQKDNQATEQKMRKRIGFKPDNH